MTHYAKAVRGFELLLEAIGIHPDVDQSQHFYKTPERAAQAWVNELCKGVNEEPPLITTFPAENIDEMILLRNIPVRSLCAHHLLPFVGTATVGYVPGRGQIIGLSKLSRIVDHYARRPQVQEDLTNQIADALAEHVLGTLSAGEYVVEGDTIPRTLVPQGGVGVMIQASHLCMSMRGVKHDGEMVTSALRGVFLSKPEARAEFLTLAHNHR